MPVSNIILHGNYTNINQNNIKIISNDIYTIIPSPSTPFSFIFSHESSEIIKGVVDINGNIVINNNDFDNLLSLLSSSKSQQSFIFTSNIVNPNINFTISLIYSILGGNVIIKFKFNYTENTNEYAPCFSYNTLKKILNNVDEERNFVILDAPRKNKKMLKCHLKNYGNIEFTIDHPVLYKNIYCPFNHFVKICPDITNIRILENNECDVLYNIIGHVDQLHIENQFKINDDINIFGGKFTFDLSQNDFERKIKIIKNMKKLDDKYSCYFKSIS